MVVNTVKRNNFGDFIRNHRRLMIILAVVVIVLAALIGYFFWSKNSWQMYETRYSQQFSDVYKQMGDVLALQSDTTEEQATKLQGFKDISGRIDALKDSCTVGSLIGWQRSLFQLSEKEKQCQDKLTSLTTFKEKAAIAISYLEDEKALAVILSAAPHTDKAVEEKDWQVYASGWQSAADATKAMTVSAAFDPVKQKANELTGALASGWSEVIAASGAKDKNRFMKAQEELMRTYNGLGSIADTANEHIGPVASDVGKTYESAF